LPTSNLQGHFPDSSVTWQVTLANTWPTLSSLQIADPVRCVGENA